MSTSAFRLVAGGVVICVSLGLLLLFSFMGAPGGAALVAAEPGGGAAAAHAAPAEPEPAPPEGQEYIGTKRCAPCHFEEFSSWNKTPHAKAFQLLPAKYQADAKCVKCHVTGLGEPTGFKSIKTTPALAGVTCESCHGPGSIHEEQCKPFLNVKELSKEQEKIARDSIWRMLPHAVCIDCHTVQAHKPSMTPPELLKKKR